MVAVMFAVIATLTLSVFSVSVNAAHVLHQLASSDENSTSLPLHKAARSKLHNLQTYPDNDPR